MTFRINVICLTLIVITGLVFLPSLLKPPNKKEYYLEIEKQKEEKLPKIFEVTGKNKDQIAIKRIVEIIKSITSKNVDQDGPKWWYDGDKVFCKDKLGATMVFDSYEKRSYIIIEVSKIFKNDKNLTDKKLLFIEKGVQTENSERNKCTFRFTREYVRLEAYSFIYTNRLLLLLN